MPDDKLDAPTKRMAVQASDLTRNFGGLTAVDQATLTINNGEIYGFSPIQTYCF